MLSTLNMTPNLRYFSTDGTLRLCAEVVDNIRCEVRVFRKVYLICEVYMGQQEKN